MQAPDDARRGLKDATDKVAELGLPDEFKPQQAHAFRIPSAKAVVQGIYGELASWGPLLRWTLGPLAGVGLFSSYLLRYLYVWAYDWADWRLMGRTIREAWTRGVNLGFHTASGGV